MKKRAEKWVFLKEICMFTLINTEIESNESKNYDLQIIDVENLWGIYGKSKFSGSNITSYDAIRGLTTIMVSSQY